MIQIEKSASPPRRKRTGGLLDHHTGGLGGALAADSDQGGQNRDPCAAVGYTHSRAHLECASDLWRRQNMGQGGLLPRPCFAWHRARRARCGHQGRDRVLARRRCHCHWLRRDSPFETRRDPLHEPMQHLGGRARRCRSIPTRLCWRTNLGPGSRSGGALAARWLSSTATVTPAAHARCMQASVPTPPTTATFSSAGRPPSAIWRRAAAARA